MSLAVFDSGFYQGFELGSSLDFRRGSPRIGNEVWVDFCPLGSKLSYAVTVSSEKGTSGFGILEGRDGVLGKADVDGLFGCVHVVSPGFE
jgi:hypothetical protein